MRQTLFYIPHADPFFGWPLFGWGWLLAVWTVLSVVLLGWLVRRQGWSADTRGYLPLLIITALAVLFLLPNLEAVQDGQPLGIPIRGYGVMLLIGVVSGVALAAHRAARGGVDPEVIFSLAFWLFLRGILGARAFYVVQYWDQFQKSSFSETVLAIVNMAQGGLVVYGSLIVLLIAMSIFVRRHKLPALALGDLIAPSMALGLAFGRLGCLLNGCCYGDLCDHPWAVAFPQSSPLYQHQHRLGLLHGIRIGSDEQNNPVIHRIVDPNGPAARRGLKIGDLITAIDGHPVMSADEARFIMQQAKIHVMITTHDGRTIGWSIAALPSHSHPVHPTQIYSSINAALICLFLLAYDPFRRRDGEVLAIMLGIYAVSRFLLEIIRTDEDAILQTGLTISQNVSILMLLSAAALGIYIARQPRGCAWPVGE